MLPDKSRHLLPKTQSHSCWYIQISSPVDNHTTHPYMYPTHTQTVTRTYHPSDSHTQVHTQTQSYTQAVNPCTATCTNIPSHGHSPLQAYKSTSLLDSPVGSHNCRVIQTLSQNTQNLMVAETSQL